MITNKKIKTDLFENIDAYKNIKNSIINEKHIKKPNQFYKRLKKNIHDAIYKFKRGNKG